jgi:hypothetical protein
MDHPANVIVGLPFAALDRSIATAQHVIKGGPISILTALFGCAVGLGISNRAARLSHHLNDLPVHGCYGILWWLAFYCFTIPIFASLTIWLLLQVLALAAMALGGVLAAVHVIVGVSVTLPPTVSFIVSIIYKEREHHFTGRLIEWVSKRRGH